MKQDKETDDLTRRLISKAGMEEPSADFTSALMKRIDSLPARAPFVYRPVITARGWLYTVFAFVVLCLAAAFIPSTGKAPAFANYLDSFLSLSKNSSAVISSLMPDLSSLTIVAAVIISAWILLAADSFLRNMAPGK